AAAAAKRADRSKRKRGSFLPRQVYSSLSDLVRDGFLAGVAGVSRSTALGVDLVGFVGDFLGGFLVQRRSRAFGGLRIGRRRLVGGRDPEFVGNSLNLVGRDRLVGHAGHHFAELVGGDLVGFLGWALGRRIF